MGIFCLGQRQKKASYNIYFLNRWHWILSHVRVRTNRLRTSLTRGPSHACTVQNVWDSLTLEIGAAVAGHREWGRSRYERQLMARALDSLERIKQKAETKLVDKVESISENASRGNAAGAIAVVNRMPMVFPTPQSTIGSGLRMRRQRRARRVQNMVYRTGSLTPMCSATGGPELT
jgi:hypothetical protein